MAVGLNKNRMFLSRLSVAFVLVFVLFSNQFFAEEDELHELLETIGVFLTGLCAMGRIYSSAFLGGYKNDQLITDGIYSMMRNPLYFFSLVGVLGASLLSNHLIVIAVLPLTFLAIYYPLIKREERFLTEKFGHAYLEYKKSVPALWPRFSNYHAPEKIEFYPFFLSKAFLDAIWWIAILPIIEFVEYLQEANILPTLFVS